MSAGGAAAPLALGLVDPASPAYWSDIHGTLAPLRERHGVVRSTACSPSRASRAARSTNGFGS